MNELTQETETGPGNTPIAEYDYTYRADGSRRPKPTTSGSPTTDQNVEVTNNISYTYDALDRLIDEAFSTTPNRSSATTPPSRATSSSGRASTIVHLRPRQQHSRRGDPGTGRNHQTTTSTYDANDRLFQQVETTSGGTSGSSTTTTEYTYNDTEQTSETAISGTPSSPGTTQSSQQYQYNLQGQMSAPR